MGLCSLCINYALIVKWGAGGAPGTRDAGLRKQTTFLGFEVSLHPENDVYFSRKLKSWTRSRKVIGL
jgi:hypothetical protein